MAGRKTFRYKGIRVNAFGLPVFTSKKENNKFSKKIRKRGLYHVSFVSCFKDTAPKNLVWVGPSPLPKDFLDYLKEIKIGDKFKTLKLAKPYNSSISAMA